MKIIIAPYSDSWPVLFEHEATVIRKALESLQPVIDHIGSTSVPGLAAKPVIDILVGLRREEDLSLVVKPMQDEGYTYFRIYEPMMPYRRFFVKLQPLADELPPAMVDTGDVFNRGNFENKVNIHIIPKDSEHWLRHIAFRDYLRAHPDVMEAYAQLKQTIAQQEFKDVFEYNDAKDSFVKETERRAVEWYKVG